MVLKNKNKSQLNLQAKTLSIFVIGIFLFSIFIFDQSKVLAQDTINTLNQEIQSKKQSINDLQQQIDAYQQKINQKISEAKTLNNQLAIIKNQIAKLGLDIQASEINIDKANLEIQSLNLQIKQTEEQIGSKKTDIKKFINLIYKNDQVSYLEALLSNQSLSDFFNYFKNTQTIQSNLKQSLDQLKNGKNLLDTQLADLETKKSDEEKIKDTLLTQKAKLAEQSGAQAILLAQAKMTQKQYEQYAKQLKIQQQQANADITTLEQKIRSESDRLQNLGSSALDWPVNPARGITTLFHDPDYPFRYLFEHPAIDIRAAQGTTIKAPADAYVGKIQFRGDTSYAYLLLVHADGISTVYGHISKPLVKEGQYVKRGQAVALTGAAPGSIGAGPLTTGPHLHLEVRLNGIPVDPLKYLPAF
ncbi:MAG: peptidoglycan DD-metalloendopeptidase family protein [Candidatus Buchananbacteria bacterium]|nr:peptidoglycan DD-metalloendopeptidase family protein [Candidatus Buchananbacteria bacterium]